MTKSYINYRDMLIRAYCYIYINKQFIKQDEILYDDCEKGISIVDEDFGVIKCTFELKITNTKDNKLRAIVGIIKLTEGDLKFMLESLVNNYIY